MLTSAKMNNLATSSDLRPQIAIFIRNIYPLGSARCDLEFSLKVVLKSFIPGTPVTYY